MEYNKKKFMIRRIFFLYSSIFLIIFGIVITAGGSYIIHSYYGIDILLFGIFLILWGGIYYYLGTPKYIKETMRIKQKQKTYNISILVMLFLNGVGALIISILFILYEYFAACVIVYLLFAFIMGAIINMYLNVRRKKMVFIMR